MKREFKFAYVIIICFVFLIGYLIILFADNKVTTQPKNVLDADFVFINLDTIVYYAPGIHLNFEDYSSLKKANRFLPVKDILSKKTDFNDVVTFHIPFSVPDSLLNKTLGLIMDHNGASAIFLNGVKMTEIGKVSDNIEEAYREKPNQFICLPVPLSNYNHNVLTIVYSNHKCLDDYQKNNEIYAGITELKLVYPFYEYSFSKFVYSITNSTLLTFFVCFLYTLTFIHLLIYFFNKKIKSNLYYSLFTFTYGGLFFLLFLQTFSFDIDFTNQLNDMLFVIIPLIFFSLSLFLYEHFYNKFPLSFKIIFSLTLISILLSFVHQSISIIVLTIQILFSIIDALRIIFRAVKNKIKGAKILGSGVLTFGGIILLAIFTFIFIQNFTLNISGFYGLFIFADLILALLSIPISMSIFLAYDFSLINKALENEKLNLEVKVKERTKELAKQKDVLETKNKEITDSISYAKRIQDAILPSYNQWNKHLPISFIYYLPKDIVAGDFYWLETGGETLETTVYFAAADCTGHGVPGAMVSVVCSNALTKTVVEEKLTEPGKILDRTRELVIERFAKSSEDVKDGMDISLCAIDFKNMTLQWAGANNPLWIVRNVELEMLNDESKKEYSTFNTQNLKLIEIKPDKQPIGKVENPQPFTTHTIELQKGDTIYIFTDGFADQFGGPKGKKFKYKPFKELLLSIQDKSMDEQKQIIEKTFIKWKGDLEQVDDVCIIGVRI